MENKETMPSPVSPEVRGSEYKPEPTTGAKSDMQSKGTKDLECEKTVIGHLLNHMKEWNENSDFLSEGLFTDLVCKNVYSAAKTCLNRGDDVDYISVNAEIRSNPSKYAGISENQIKVLAQFGGISNAPIRPKVIRLNELWQRRQLCYIGIQLEKAGNDESVSISKTQDDAITELRDLYSTHTSDIKSMRDVVNKFMQEVVKANKEGTRKSFIHSGFKALEDIGAFQFSDMWVIAADSSQGKTSFVDAIAFHAASTGIPTVIYSMEMTSLQLCGRVMATRTGIPNGILSTRTLTEEQTQRVVDAGNVLKNLPVYFDEKSTISLDGILSSIRTLYYKKGIKLAIVDYLQIVNLNLKNATREQAVANAARRFKNLAKELNICIVLLSQLSRDKADPKPKIERLRDSGQITEAADGVILIWRPEYYGTNYHYPKPFEEVSTSGTAYIEVAKGRNVGKLSFIAGFDAKLTKFYDVKAESLPKRRHDTIKENDGDPF